MVVTETRVQAVTSNLNASELFACKWLRAPATIEIDRTPTLRRTIPWNGLRVCDAEVAGITDSPFEDQLWPVQ